MREAKVVTGSRGPEAREKARVASDKSALAQVAALIAKDTRDRKKPLKEQPNRVVYQARATGYRLTLEAPSDTFDPGTGKRTFHRGITWQFSGGIYVSNDPKEQSIAEAKRGFGLDGDFWRASEAATRDVQRAVAELVKTVKGAPESIRAEALAALSAGSDEFKLPEIPVEDEPAEGTKEQEE